MKLNFDRQNCTIQQQCYRFGCKRAQFSVIVTFAFMQGLSFPKCYFKITALNIRSGALSLRVFDRVLN